MKEPRRWIEESSDEFERDLLQSSRGDVPTERAYQRTLTSLGVGVLMPLAAAQVAEGAAHVVKAAALTAVAPAKPLGAVVLVKWLAGGMLLGVVTMSGVGLSSRVFRAAPAVEATVPAVPAEARAVTVAPNANPVAVAAPGRESVQVSNRPAAVAGRRNVAASPPPIKDRVTTESIAPPSAGYAIEPKPRDAKRSLEREMQLLDTARRALAENAAADALSALRRYSSEFAAGALAPEARLLEVRALLQSGERARANELGQRIIASAPESQHAEAVRALLGRSPNP